MSSTPAPPPQDEGRGREAGQRHCELLERLSPSSSPGSTGRSSIPETSGLSTNVSGMPAAPLKAGHDSGGGRRFAFSRRQASELFIRLALNVSRGRREGRVPHAPMVRVQQKSTWQNHRYRRINRPSLRNGFTAYT